MPDALVGYTGFVGGNLLRQTHFDDTYNSKNIQTISGKQYRQLVCCALPAAKWIANREPDADLANVQNLIACLNTVRADRVVLISTVDVYPQPVGVDESTEIAADNHHAYGRHRFDFECALRRIFERVTVVRLPALFGNGLKKNALYDLINGNDIHKIHCESIYQFFNLQHLWRDVQICLDADIEVVNLVTEPISMAELAHEAFALDFTNRTEHGSARYDIRTVHHKLFDGPPGYICSKEEVMSDIKHFVVDERKRLHCP